MSAPALVTSITPLGTIDDEALARLREALVADRAAQMALEDEHRATATALTGERDVVSLLEREIADASVVHARDAVEDIDEALARMDAGTYGLCESCQSPIPLERLEAIPRARRCVACADLPASSPG
jgi:DnaK suppressor protein